MSRSRLERERWRDTREFSLNRQTRNGDVILHDHELGRTLLFSPSQIRLYLDVDAELRRGRFNTDQHPIPVGYDDFQYLWSLDQANRYELAALDYRKGPGAPALKRSLPKGAILPYGDPAQATATPQSSADEALIHRLLLRTAQQSLRASDNARAGFEEREARRDRNLLNRIRSQAVHGPLAPLPGAPLGNSNTRTSRRKRQRRRSPSVVLVDPDLDVLLTPLLAGNDLTVPGPATSAGAANELNNTAVDAPRDEVEMGEGATGVMLAATAVNVGDGDPAGLDGLEPIFGDADEVLFD